MSLLTDTENVLGEIPIYDYSTVKFSHLFKMSLGPIKNYTRYMQVWVRCQPIMKILGSQKSSFGFVHLKLNKGRHFQKTYEFYMIKHNHNKVAASTFGSQRAMRAMRVRYHAR